MSSTAPSRKLDQFLLRLPDGMRERLAKAAKENNRSVNAEIVSRLEESFQADAAEDPEQFARLMREMRAVVRVYEKRPDVFLDPDPEEENKLLQAEMERGTRAKKKTSKS